MQLTLGDIRAEVTYKRIKRLNLRVLPPRGEVRISAPTWMGSEAVRAFVLTNAEWIRKQQKKFQQQVYPPAPKYLDGERHYVWGQPLELRVERNARRASAQAQAGRLRLSVPPGTSKRQREAVLAAWYREQTRAAALPLVRLWEPRVGRRISRLSVQQMKTRWGSCNPAKRSVRLNSELAKRPPQFLEYVVVHELVHLIEPSHNQRFKRLMSDLLPDWRQLRKALNNGSLEPD